MKHNTIIRSLSLLSVFVSVTALQSAAFELDDSRDSYEERAASSIVSARQEQLDSGMLELIYHPRHGYLKSVLDAFDIPPESQLLVFSKTSQLREHINPRNPRAIYFNDQVYVAWVPGTPHIEIAAIEPKVGSVFYVLEQKEQKIPKFDRNNQCLECHTSSKNLGVPGPLVRSFPTDEKGAVDRFQGVSSVTHRTPIKYRWGGWYATGNTVQMHRGNKFGKTKDNAPNSVDDLRTFLDVGKYPAASSDIVAIMVLEHQAHMHNLITRLHRDAAAAMAKDGHIRDLKDDAETLLKYLLFVDEAPLKGPIRGNTDYAKVFQSRGIKDGKGRSLRQLDLKSRLFRHPCSYLIYSQSFQKMHPVMRKHLIRRLHAILTGEDQSDAFASLTKDQRREIKDILTATLPDLPAYWSL